MSYFLRNVGSAGPVGLFFVLFLLGSRGGRLPSISQIISYGELTRNMHRMVDMLDQLEGLTHLISPPSSGQASGAGSFGSSGDAFAASDELTEVDAFDPDDFGRSSFDAGNFNRGNFGGFNSNNFNGGNPLAGLSLNNLPDMGQLMEMAAPFLAALNRQ